MIKYPCIKCGRHSQTQTEMGVKEFLHGVVLIYGLPFFCFLAGIFIGIACFNNLEGKYIYSIILGFFLMIVSYRALKQLNKGE